MFVRKQNKNNEKKNEEDHMKPKLSRINKLQRSEWEHKNLKESNS